MLKKLLIKHFSILLFLFFLTVISVYYDYPEISFKRPQSVHKWRQSDCASIALNYYQGEMDFFDPEVHNLTSDGGTTGKCYTSEIPILYYAVAVLYKLFAYHDYIFRIFNTLLFFLGLFYLFKLFRYVLKDDFWAISLTLLFFSSPVLVYYGNNFLSNSSALAFSIIGWYYFIRFYSEKQQNWFYISMLMFFLSASFKITGLFSLFAIAGVFTLENAGLLKFRGRERLFNHPFRQVLLMSAVFLSIGWWIIVARNYNQSHSCNYFSTTIFPLWSLDRLDIRVILDKIYNIWLYQYFHLSALLFLLGCFLFILFHFNKNKKLFITSILFILTEAIVFIILQFWTFGDHDYYTIGMYILPVLIMVSTFDLLNRHFSHLLKSKPIKIIFTLFLLFNVMHAHNMIDLRYTGWMNDYNKYKDLYSITPYLRQLGISPNDTIISMPDESHVSLYLMNQKGWTNYSDANFNRGEKSLYNQDSISFQNSIDRGAHYFVLNGINELNKRPYLIDFCTHLVGTYHDVLIFDLKDRAGNFDARNRLVESSFYCGAESVSSDGLFFIGRDSFLFKNGENQNDRFAHSGKYACKLDKKSPYGMTLSLTKLQFGESIIISVWKKSTGSAKGEIIVSTASSGQLDISTKVIERREDGWEKISTEFFVTFDMQEKDWGIFVYNPGDDPVYFDDLEIFRYQSVF